MRAACEAILVEIGHRPADIVQLPSHGAEREHVQPLIVEGAGRQVLASVFLVVAAGHQVHVHSFHVARKLKFRVQFQRAPGFRLVRQAPARAVELPALLFDAVHHNVPDHLLGRAPGGGVSLENVPAAHCAMHVGAVRLIAAAVLFDVRGDAGLIVRAHGCGKIVEHKTA